MKIFERFSGKNRIEEESSQNSKKEEKKITVSEGAKEFLGQERERVEGSEIDFETINRYYESCARVGETGTKEQKVKAEKFFEYLFKAKASFPDRTKVFSEGELERISGPYLKQVIKNSEVYQLADLIERIAEVNKITIEKAALAVLDNLDGK